MNLAAPAALAAALWLSSTGGPCAQDGVVHRETGTASFYGTELAGRRTASGERYDPAGLTAAHPTLPFGAEITVVALASGRRVTVEVNDRGPFIRGRSIDLSLLPSCSASSSREWPECGSARPESSCGRPREPSAQAEQESGHPRRLSARACDRETG